MLTRRRFLQNAAAGAAIGSLATPTASETWRELTARAAAWPIAPPEFGQTDLWTFGGSLPGTELRFAQGDRLAIRVRNDLPQPTSVHWHGLRLPNGMDGVPDMTQPPIGPGESFDYAFELKDAGSFWYHSHLKSTEQVERGLYGPLIVDEAEAPDIDADIVLVLDDILLNETATLVEGFDNMHDASHAGRLGNLILTNGSLDWRTRVQPGMRLRLRLINAATARIFQLGLQGMRGWTMALDGMPLAKPQGIEGRFLLAPAQRADLFVDVLAEPGSPASLVHFLPDGGYAQATFDVGEGGGRTARGMPDTLPPNPVLPPPDLSAALALEMRMEGGMMGGMQQASFDGRMMDMRELMQHGHVWALNGVAGMPEAPFAELSEGQPVRMKLINDTAFPHAMHLHGMHFAEVLPDGKPGPLRDTVLVMPQEMPEIAFTAGPPGKWLFHCHMLSHQASGMKTWFRIV